MSVTVEGKPCAFQPTVPCCPEHCVTGQLVETISGINECQPLWSINTFLPLIPLCFGSPGRILTFFHLEFPEIIVYLSGTE
jgi:hypothetical protein